MTIRVQYVSGTVPDGVTQHVLTAPTHFQAIGSLSSAFILPATTYPTVGLGTEGGLSQTRCWALNCDINTTSQILLNRGNETGATDFAFWIIEYVGPAGGPNEFIMRGKRIFNFDPDSAETTDSNPIFGITNVNRTVPFINGRHENANSSALRNFIASCSFVASGANWVAQLHRSLTTNGDPTYVVYAVEFTGSNWSVEPGFISFWLPNTNDDTAITPVTVGKAWLYGHFRAGDRDTPAGQTFYAWLQGTDTLRTRTIEVSNTSVFRYWVIGNSDIRFGVSVQNNVNGVVDIAAGGTGAQSQNLSIASAQDNGTVVTGWLGSSSTTTADQPSGCWRIRRVPNTPDLVEVYRSRSQGSTEYILQTVTFPTDAATTVTLTPQRGLLTLSGNVANGPVIREPATAQLFMRELGPFSEVFRTPGVGSIQLQGRQSATPAFPGTALVSLSQLVPFLGLTKIIEIPVPALDYDSKVNAPPTVIIGTILAPEPAALSVQALQHAATEGGDIATRVPGVAILSMVADLAILGLENTNPVALPLVGLEPEVIRVSAIAEPEAGLLNAPGFAAQPVGIFIPFQWIDVDPAPVVEWSD
jgi:hypothetical protein